LRPVLALLALASASACASDFRPRSTTTVESPWANVRAVRLSTGPRTEVRVRLLVNANERVRLRNALLAASETPPCTSDKTFVTFERDGSRVLNAPIAIDGAHRFDITFDDRPGFQRLEDDGAVDLVLERDGGHGCVRVPLLGERAPDWQSTDEPRFAMGAEVESYPLRYRDHGRLTPIGGAGFWFGAEDANHRVFLLQSAAFTSGPTSRASGHIGLTLGGARRLVSGGPLSFKVVAAYQGDLYYARESDEQRAVRHTLHGPLLGPLLSLDLGRGRYAPATAGGTLHLELGAPTLLWFGAPGARGVTLVGGVTFGCFGVF
jgi:hypothetical protein